MFLKLTRNRSFQTCKYYLLTFLPSNFFHIIRSEKTYFHSNKANPFSIDFYDTSSIFFNTHLCS